MDELNAVRATQAGDRAAFDILINQYYKSIYRFAYHVTGSSQDADDICQETFLRAYEGIKKLQNRESFKGWIFMIAANLSRSSIKDSRFKMKLAEKTSVNSYLQTGGDCVNQPFESLSSKEKTQIIQKQLLNMPEQMRLATILVHIEDFTQKQAAELLNCSEATISRQLSSAMTLMKNRLQNLV
jgi:RNA polymerase sigma-70 factor, ECF subfamily